jgi:serine/threonine-protein kinase
MKPASAKICPSCGERYEPDVLFCPRDGTPLTNARTPSVPGSERDVYLGLDLGGQIQLKHLIGIGSMGRVYRAWQSGIERDVAVKILHRELSGNVELVSRFHREAKVASRLVHPNVVQVLMTGAVPNQPGTQIGGELYLVMEYLDGISLLSAMAAAGTSSEGSALPLPRALHIALQICDAVGEAHKQGIVHRDIKPENVMLVRRGDDPDYVKVLDFGIARLNWGDASMASTQAGLIFGTAKYISPEGAEGQPVGPAADVYAIATILYQCLAGRTPFEGDSPVSLLVQHTHAPPPELRGIARASYVPPAIAAVVMRNLSKSASERAPNARVMGRELVAAARASGLDPEEIVSQSALLFQRGKGAVKLASKERTKALDLSPELATKIGGVAARPRDQHDAEAAPRSPPPRAAHQLALTRGAGTARGRALSPADKSGDAPSPRSAGRAARGASGAPSSRPSSRQNGAEGIAARLGDNGRPSRPRRASAPPEPTRSARPPVTAAAVDFDDESPESAPLQSTMQGTETTLSGEHQAPTTTPPPRRARMVRLVAIAACAVAAALIVVLGGRQLGGFGGASASGDSIEAQLEAARDCMRRRAWDAPARQNVKEITDTALARWPDDARIVDLRREAAERLVSDALGRKYAGDSEEAIHLARLATEFHPQLTTAQHLVAELEGDRSPAVAPAAGSELPVAPEPAPGSKGNTARRPTTPGPLPRGSASAHPPGPKGTGSPVLPPSPPPLPGDHAPAAPSSTGPWL